LFDNLSVPDVVFSGNSVMTASGPIDIGTNGVVIGNYLESVGDATHASLNQTSSYTGAIFSNNRIVSPPQDGISVGRSDNTISGNRITNATRRGINVSASASGLGGHNVTGNHIDTCVDGLVINSNVANSVFHNNTVLNASSGTYTYTTNANFQTNFFDPASNVGDPGVSFSYTIATGAITIGRSDRFLIVDTEGSAATDDLDTINGGGYVGHIVILRSANAARVVTVKDGTQLRMAGNFILNGINDALTLQWTGSQWYELSRSDNN
jgi:hypothetical protein